MVLGITGGMGSGKSTLARLFAGRGALLVDADAIAREVVDRPEVLGALRAAFGDAIVDGEGRLRRRELGSIAFASRDGLERLEAIVRPHLARALWERLEEARSRAGEGMVVCDAPLIFEWGEEDRFDAVVVVDADEKVRIERVARRTPLSEAEIRQRMALQMPVAEKRRRADYVLSNNGDMREFERRAAALWESLNRVRREDLGDE